jgi:hypothetical protein
MNNRPRVIRITELADLLGVSNYVLRSAARTAGIQLVNIRRALGVHPKNSPLYLAVPDAAVLATALLGKACDVSLKHRLRNIAKRQDNAFGPNPIVELAT